MNLSTPIQLGKSSISVAVALFLSINCIAAERIFEDSIDVNPDVKFTVNSHRGEIKVTTANTNTIEIKAIITHDLEEALETVEIDINKSSSRVTVEADYNDQPINPLSWFNPRNFYHPHVRFEIVIPDTASLTISSHRSSMDISAPSGYLRVESHRGNGNISHIRNDLTLDTHRGNFDLGIDELHDIRVETHRGNIDLDIAQASDIAFDVSTHRGAVNIFGKDIDVNNHDRESYVDYKEGTGENLIKIDSHRGNIGIRFVD